MCVIPFACCDHCMPLMPCPFSQVQVLEQEIQLLVSSGELVRAFPLKYRHSDMNHCDAARLLILLRTEELAMNIKLVSSNNKKHSSYCFSAHVQYAVRRALSRTAVLDPLSFAQSILDAQDSQGAPGQMTLQASRLKRGPLVNVIEYAQFEAFNLIPVPLDRPTVRFEMLDFGHQQEDTEHTLGTTVSLNANNNIAWGYIHNRHARFESVVDGKRVNLAEDMMLTPEQIETGVIHMWL
jgi:hypothetical protein